MARAGIGEDRKRRPRSVDDVLKQQREMATQVHMAADEGVDEALKGQIRSWASEVLERAPSRSSPPSLHISIWKTIEELQNFYRREKEALGVITGGETDFLATHEAWRGYPRVHICQQTLKGIPAHVVQGALHHEITHAIHHGSPEFYTFQFTGKLQEAARSQGLDLPLLQQCVYLMSIAIKDAEVVQWLVEVGLGFGQYALFEHMISDTDEERRIWEGVRSSSVLRKIAYAAFLKTLLPIELMVSGGIERARALRNQWGEAYGWLSERERECLFRLTHYAMNQEHKNFQDQLEGATLWLINEPSI